MSSWHVAIIAGCALASSACARARPEPAVEQARERYVSAPSRIAFISSDHAVTGLSNEIRFGGPKGRSALYLQFPHEWQARGVPRRAFLTLSAREGSESSGVPLTLEAWRISADWQPQTLRHWSQKPSLGLPYTRAHITPSMAREVRLDVSEIVRFAAQNPEREYGIAVIGSGSDGPFASFNSGFAGGLAPRLEVYLR